MADDIEITQGENAEFDIKLRDGGGDPFNLTDFDQFKICFPSITTSSLEVSEVSNAAGSFIEISGNPVLGVLKVEIKFADTANLKIGSGQDIVLQLNNSATPNPKKKRFERVLRVEDGGC